MQAPTDAQQPDVQRRRERDHGGELSQSLGAEDFDIARRRGGPATDRRDAWHAYALTASGLALAYGIGYSPDGETPSYVDSIPGVAWTYQYLIDSDPGVVPMDGEISPGADGSGGLIARPPRARRGRA